MNTTSSGTDDRADVRMERLPGGIAAVTLDRPRRKNALDDRMWRGLAAALDALEKEPPRAVVLSGTGDAFCSGMDVSPANPLIQRFFEGLTARSEPIVREHLSSLRNVFARLAALAVPKIAAINGVAFGGGAELALCCELRVMDAGATIAFSEARLGLMADLGGTARLGRLLGTSRAADLLFTTRPVGAEEALGLGLANRVAPAGTALQEALALAHEVAAQGPNAVRASLRTLRAVAAGAGEAAALDRELEEAVRLILTGEAMEGIAAFLEKRKPAFPQVAAS